MNSTTTPLYTASLHWVIFIWPTLLCLAGLFLLNTYPIFFLPGLLFAVFSLIWFILNGFNYHYSYLTVSSKQLVLTTGFMVRQSINIPLVKIESIDVRQPILGSILGFGSIYITGTGGTKYFIHNLSHPLTCRRKIEEMLGHAL